jgi:HAD superfamily hydrolase (TIGR01484 family)
VKPFDGGDKLHPDPIIRRKTGMVNGTLGTAIREIWTQSLSQFRDRLQHTAIHAIVFDYDGTLVEVNQRFAPPQDEMSFQLVRLLSSGVRLGIATGRGKSVWRDLREVIPIGHWPDVLIGYHNGSELGSLADDYIRTEGESLHPAIETALQILSEAPTLSGLVKIDSSPRQLSIQWKVPVFACSLSMLLEHLVPSLAGCGVRLVASGHSVDVLAPNVSKLSVIAALAKSYEITEAEILAIGDQGQSTGNDHELLAHFPSLSVDRVSPDPTTCWRLTPPSLRGPSATLWYLRRLVARKRNAGARFKTGSM